MKVDFIKGALPYAEQLGWFVFPLAMGWKLPAIKSAHPKGNPKHGVCRGECGRQGHGVYDASADPKRIAEWARQFPCANIGIACGEPSGFDVIDIDPRNAGDQTIRAFAARGYLVPPAPRQRTGNGGWHLLFKHAPGGRPRGKLGQASMSNRPAATSSAVRPGRGSPMTAPVAPMSGKSRPSIRHSRRCLCG
jgi:hypothetical protein